MTTQHTPGPWQLARPNYDLATIELETVERGPDVPDQGYTLATIWSDDPRNTDGLLMAAAPDLLAALVTISTWLYAPDMDAAEDMQNVALNAIIKARTGPQS